MFATTRKSILMAAFTAAMLSLTACGGKIENVLKDANLSLAHVDGQEVVSLMTELDTDNIVISAATLQISKSLGTLEILNDVTTKKTYLKLSFKLGKALQLPSFSYYSKLPNGLSLPLTGIDLNKVMAFDLGSKGSKVYLYYDATTKKAVIGTALNVETLAIQTPATVLGAFELGNVTGVAGLYFGEKANTSGVGIFADLSGIFPILGSDELSIMARQPVGFKEYKTTAEKQNLIDRKLYELSSKKAVIRLK